MTGNEHAASGLAVGDNTNSGEKRLNNGEMGFEFMIRVRLTSDEKKEVEYLLKRSKSFCQITGDGLLCFGNDGSSPEWFDSIAGLCEEGIYVCQNLFPEPWHSLESLKEYLTRNKKDFTLEDL